MNAVVESQQEVLCQLEARGILGPQLPNTVQEEQEDWGLEGGRERKVRGREEGRMKGKVGGKEQEGRKERGKMNIGDVEGKR